MGWVKNLLATIGISGSLLTAGFIGDKYDFRNPFEHI